MLQMGHSGPGISPKTIPKGTKMTASYYRMRMRKKMSHNPLTKPFS